MLQHTATCCNTLLHTATYYRQSSILSSCNSLCVAATHSICLQLTLHMAATDFLHGCNSPITSTLYHPHTSLYIPATHSTHGCNSLNIRLQLAYSIYTPSSTYLMPLSVRAIDSITLQLTLYPFNSLHTWLQLTQHTAATELLPLHSVLDITCSLCACNGPYGCDSLSIPATHSTRRCNSLYIRLQLTQDMVATKSSPGCN